jgi:hypothetical protein
MSVLNSCTLAPNQESVIMRFLLWIAVIVLVISAIVAIFLPVNSFDDVI